MTSEMPAFTALRLETQGPVAWIYFNRPASANAFDLPMWDELPLALRALGSQRSVRAVVLAGDGKHFCAGIDLSVIEWLQSLTAPGQPPTRGREAVLAFIERAQAAITAIEQCPVPVIAAIHGACVGGAVDLIAACDLRLCSSDAKFCVKELDLAVVPDVGTLQRLTRVIGYAVTAELTYSAETFDSARALRLGLVSRVCDTRESLYAAAGELASSIAAKSPATVRGVKRNLLFARDHSVQTSLAYNAAWNAAMLVGEDLQEALAAARQKRASRYSD